MGRRARSLTETDAAEWARYAQRVTPLRGVAAHPEIAAMTSAKASVPAVREVLRRGPRPAATGSAQPALLGVGGQPAGVDTASWQKFRRGQLVSARKLDL